MNKLIKHKESDVWRKSVDYVIAINHIVRNFPQKEREEKGMYCQLLQAVVRITLRIVESRVPLLESELDLLIRARYHLSETEFLLDVAYHFAYIDIDERMRLNQAGKELRTLINEAIYQAKEKMEVLGY
jgi:four helix bundle protein